MKSKLNWCFSFHPLSLGCMLCLVGALCPANDGSLSINCKRDMLVRSFARIDNPCAWCTMMACCTICCMLYGVMVYSILYAICSSSSQKHLLDMRCGCGSILYSHISVTSASYCAQTVFIFRLVCIVQFIV